MEINERFPVLSTIAKFLWALGIIILIIGAIPFILELIESVKYFTTSGARWVWTLDHLSRIGTVILSLVIGLVIMAVAESIGVLFAIEKNTRQR